MLMGKTFGAARANCYAAAAGFYYATGEAIPVPSFVRGNLSPPCNEDPAMQLIRKFYFA
jgi:hypothetical protein